MNQTLEWRNQDTVVRVLGGYREIGGNLIEIRYRGKRIYLDFGYSLKRYKELYEWPRRKPKGIDELINVGLAPPVDGLYTRWINEGRKPDLEYGKDTDVYAVFISHPHLDHMALLPQLNRNIPIYIGEIGRDILNLWNQVSVREKYNKYDGLVFKTFRSFNTIELDEFRVTPVHVDHSIPGSYGFIVETPDTVIGYTGDFRLHGQDPSLTYDYIMRAREYELDLLITEATRVHDVLDIKEKDVYETLLKIFSLTNKAILLDSSYIDIDRIRSIFNAAYKAGKTLVIGWRHFYFIYNLIEREKKFKLKIEKDSFKVIINLHMRKKKVYNRFIDTIYNKGFQLIDIKNLELSDNHIYLDFPNYIQYLLNKTFPGTIAIFSNSEPYDEESYLDYRKIINWLNILMIPSYRIHSSGHANPIDIKKLVNQVQPKDLIIIHSEYPDVIKKFLGY